VEAHSDEARHALILHDQPLVADLITLTLNDALFKVRVVCDLAEAEGILESWQPDLGVFDMDHDESPDLMKRLGASNALSGSVTPVVGLTRRRDLKTKLAAFDLGVDDILAVPFSPEELLARCIVVTRRAFRTDRPMVPRVKVGEIEVDIVDREVRAGNSVVHLTGTEQSILYLLASGGGRVITRDEILDAVWGSDFVAESNVVDRHVRSLRVKLQDDYRHPQFIATVSGAGYRFIPTFSNEGWGGL
jgi:two-component system, OmpR family, alkaline phosphatase synthesis response regulator PhoP